MYNGHKNWNHWNVSLWLNNDERKYLGVEYFVYPWKDNFIEQRNKYIQHAGNDGWLLTTDTDEYLEDAAAYTIRSIVANAERQGASLVNFRAHDIHIHIDGSVTQNLPKYWEPMLFKLGPGVQYTGTLHHSLRRAPGKTINSELRYFHVKSVPNMWLHGARNYWISSKMAGNASDAAHKEFRRQCQGHNINYFHEMAKHMKDGTVPEPLVEWIIYNKEHSNAEVRAYFIVYFVLLHPEKNIWRYSNIDFPYDANRKPIKGMGF